MKVEYYLEESDYGRHSEYRDMAEKLFGILRMIDIPDKQDGDEVVTRKAKASKMNYQIIENVLQFFVNYKLRQNLFCLKNLKCKFWKFNEWRMKNNGRWNF